MHSWQSLINIQNGTFFPQTCTSSLFFGTNVRGYVRESGGAGITTCKPGEIFVHITPQKWREQSSDHLSRWFHFASRALLRGLSSFGVFTLNKIIQRTALSSSKIHLKGPSVKTPFVSEASQQWGCRVYWCWLMMSLLLQFKKSTFETYFLGLFNFPTVKQYIGRYQYRLDVSLKRSKSVSDPKSQCQ